MISSDFNSFFGRASGEWLDSLERNHPWRLGAARKHQNANVTATTDYEDEDEHEDDF